MDTFWSETAPNWIEALSTAAALLAATAVAVYGWKQYQIDRSREAKSRAFGLSAWWVTLPSATDGKKLWGIVVSNTSDAVFYNVNVVARGARNSAEETSFVIRTLPPGRCFVETNWTGHVWQFPRALGHGEESSPVLGSGSHGIASFTYTDTATRSWTWTPDNGLRETRPAGKRSR